MHLETFKCVENIQKTKFELINSLKESRPSLHFSDSEERWRTKHGYPYIDRGNPTKIKYKRHGYIRA